MQYKSAAIGNIVNCSVKHSMSENNQREKPIFWEWNRGQAVYADTWKIVKNGLDKPWDLYNLRMILQKQKIWR